MATKNVNLGTIPVSRGEFNSTTIYYKDNIVQYKRGSYQVVSESPIIGVPPINDEDIVNNGWIIFAGTLSKASLIKSNTQDLSGNNVQENLNSASEKLKELKLESIYDVSAHNNGEVFESLSALLSSSNLNTIIPTSVRHGGMTIRYIQSSDNKYVQYRLMSDTFSITESDWQGVDDEPTVGSDNLLKSGGAYNEIYKFSKEIIDYTKLNLFNKDTITQNAYVRSGDGTIATGQSGWWCSDFIPVEGNTLYNGSQIRDYAFYDANKQYISGSVDLPQMPITTPENAAYIRFSQYLVSTDGFMFNKGEEAASFAPYGEIVIKQDIIPVLGNDKICDNINGGKLLDESIGVRKLDSSIIVKSANLFNKDTITQNACINYSTGSVRTGQSGWWCSDFIVVTQNTQYNGSQIRDYAFYDANKQYISGSVDLPQMPITTPENAAYIRFSQYLVPTDNFMFNEGSEALPFVPYHLLNPQLLPSSDEQIGVTLPKRIYAVVGDTIQIFFRGIIKAINPYNYDICVTASAGRMYPRYYELTASSAGTVSFNVKLKNSNGEIVGNASTVIDVKQAVAQPSSEKNVLFIGDSLTAAGVYTQEAYRRLTGTGGTPAGNEFGNIAFVGRKPYGAIHAEGNSGWSWTDYITKADRTYAECHTLTVNAVTTIPQIGAIYKDVNDNQFTFWWDYSNTKLKFTTPLLSSIPQSGVLTKVSGVGDDTITWTAAVKSSINPFWNDDTEQLDFPAYVNKWCGGKIDVVYTLLTWNALGGVIESQDFSSLVGYAKTLYRHIHTNYPDVKIKMMGIQVPDCRQGMGSLGAPQENNYTDMYKLILTALNMNTAYEELCLDSEFSSYVEFIHISSQVDSEYNMPFIEKEVNIRNSNYKDKVGTNDVHPNTDGYLQIADAVYRNFICNFCQ